VTGGNVTALRRSLGETARGAEKNLFEVLGDLIESNRLDVAEHEVASTTEPSTKPSGRVIVV